MAEIIPSNAEGIKRAASILQQGGLVAMPTETVYGLAGNALNDDAVGRIYDTKQRPAHNPLIVHIGNADHAYDYAEIKKNSKAEQLIEHYWRNPSRAEKGALTLVLSARNNLGKNNHILSPLLITPQNSVAIRLPFHPIAKALILQAGFPLAAPSANISGKLSPTRASHVQQDFLNKPEPQVILQDDDMHQCGIESTIIDARSDDLKILRYGSLDLGSLDLSDVQQYHGDSIIAPGMLSRHYSPKSKLRLNATQADKDEIMLGFGDIDGKLNLSPTGDLHEAAFHFYDYLHRLDSLNQTHNGNKIAVAPIPNHGMGLALNDRLNRAQKL